MQVHFGLECACLSAQAGCLSGLEHCLLPLKVAGSIFRQGIYTQVAGLILGRGAYGRQPVDVSLSY